MKHPLIKAALGGLLAALLAAPAAAALVTKHFSVTIDSAGSALDGQSFGGRFVYDDASVPGLGLSGEDLYALTEFSFRFDGTDYTESDLAYGDAAVDPLGGSLLGLDAAGPVFLFLPAGGGFAASFAYDTGNGDAGQGRFDIVPAPVDAPATLALALAGLAALARRRATARR